MDVACRDCCPLYVGTYARTGLGEGRRRGGNTLGKTEGGTDVYHLGLFVFFPRVFLSSRVTGACPVTTDLIMRVNVRTTTTMGYDKYYVIVVLLIQHSSWPPFKGP